MRRGPESVDIDRLWHECIMNLEGTLGRPSFENFLKESRPVSLDRDTLTIRTPNNFAREYLAGKYSKLISQTIERISGTRFTLKFISPNGSEDDKTPATEHPFPEYNLEVKSDTLLNPKYTFDTFVIGNSNHFAAAASMAVAEAPAKAYNPFFIYGGVGLGKTHLMHAIGNAVLRRNKKSRVTYVPTERFTYEMVASIADRQMVQFKRKYRSVDILLVDDIQFLANKEQIQEEFYNTFNELHSANRQIVITSDRTPKEIPTLEDRLRSRFEWGLIADIQAPDLETRQAILRKKAELEKADVPFEVVSYIAEKIPSNIRNLEGALIKIMAKASFQKTPITLEIARESLEDIISDKPGKIMDPKEIQSKVAEYYHIKVEDLRSERRDQKFVIPRHIAIYLIRELTEFSLPEIANIFGGRHHTTILHAVKKITANLNTPIIKKSIENIKDLLNVPVK